MSKDVQQLRVDWLQLSIKLAVMRLDIRNGKRELISDYNLLVIQTSEAYEAYQKAELARHESLKQEHSEWLKNTSAESRAKMYKDSKIGHL